MVRVIVADDQHLLADGIKTVLESSEKIQVVAIACDGIDCLEKVKTFNPDVVLLDIRMPNMNGVIATKHIKESYPSVSVVILTTFDDSEYILDALNYGASGYLLKDISGTALVDAVLNASKGEMVLPTGIAKKVASAAKMVKSDKEIRVKRAFGFSDRETEIALMLYEGFNNRQISSALEISEGTTRNYISSIYEKLNAENRTQAIDILKNVITK